MPELGQEERLAFPWVAPFSDALLSIAVDLEISRYLVQQEGEHHCNTITTGVAVEMLKF